MSECAHITEGRERVETIEPSIVQILEIGRNQSMVVFDIGDGKLRSFKHEGILPSSFEDRSTKAGRVGAPRGVSSLLRAAVAGVTIFVGGALLTACEMPEEDQKSGISGPAVAGARTGTKQSALTPEQEAAQTRQLADLDHLGNQQPIGSAGPDPQGRPNFGGTDDDKQIFTYVEGGVCYVVTGDTLEAALQNPERVAVATPSILDIGVEFNVDSCVSHNGRVEYQLGDRGDPGITAELVKQDGVYTGDIANYRLIDGRTSMWDMTLVTSEDGSLKIRFRGINNTLGEYDPSNEEITPEGEREPWNYSIANGLPHRSPQGVETASKANHQGVSYAVKGRSIAEVARALVNARLPGIGDDGFGITRLRTMGGVSVFEDGNGIFWAFAEPPECGDEVCESDRGEDANTCPADCFVDPCIVDGICGDGETVENCAADCVVIIPDAGGPDAGIDPPDEGTPDAGTPDEGVNPPDEGVDPPDEGVDPPDEGVDPPDEGVNPPDEGVDPPDEGVNPPDEGVDPPDEGGSVDGGPSDTGTPDVEIPTHPITLNTELGVCTIQIIEETPTSKGFEYKGEGTRSCKFKASFAEYPGRDIYVTATREDNGTIALNCNASMQNDGPDGPNCEEGSHGVWFEMDKMGTPATMKGPGGYLTGGVGTKWRQRTLSAEREGKRVLLWQVQNRNNVSDGRHTANEEEIDVFSPTGEWLHGIPAGPIFQMVYDPESGDLSEPAQQTEIPDFPDVGVEDDAGKTDATVDGGEADAGGEPDVDTKPPEEKVNKGGEGCAEGCSTGGSEGGSVPLSVMLLAAGFALSRPRRRGKGESNERSPSGLMIGLNEILAQARQRVERLFRRI